MFLQALDLIHRFMSSPSLISSHPHQSPENIILQYLDPRTCNSTLFVANQIQVPIFIFKIFYHWALQVCIPSQFLWWQLEVGSLRVIRSREESLQMNSINLLLRELPESPLASYVKNLQKGHLWLRMWVFPRHQNCWFSCLGIPGLYNQEKHICCL